MMRALGLILGSVFAASLAHAQGASIEKCTGNFEEAQLKEKRGKLIEAEQLYAACAETKCPSMVRTDCTAKRDEMTRRMPTITIVVRDAAGNDVTANVEIDGKPVTDRAHAQAIDPGEHVVSYRAEGRKPATQKITVVEGEKARVITITAKDGKEPTPPASTTPASAPPPNPSPAPPAPQSGPDIVGPVILGSVGLILIGTGITFQFLANGEEDKSNEFRAKADDIQTAPVNREELQAAANSRHDAAKNDQLIALLTFSGGVLFLAGGVTWYLVSRPSKKTSSIVPLIAPGFAGASYGLRF